ncbi:autotransporter domain-containing protein [Cupriavidus agavae]|uniref:Outer membrane autotransporter protein n=1 Tax=Cupriavidus agavae TaxID=1001822 RepID=A0A4Q7S797_9BURK|nr:autotransporter domain-containing protein [Cupriavidus agavae]RZT42274.1 outer membrane autotransporter protein [Cupriavidus agavae]
MSNHISAIWKQLPVTGTICAMTVLGIAPVYVASAARAQTVIPAGTDIGTYIIGSTAGTPHWSSSSYQFAMGADANWNTVVNLTSSSPLPFSLDGQGHTVRRGSNSLFNFSGSAKAGTDISLSNITISDSGVANRSVFDFGSAQTGTVKISLNNVRFDGLNGAYASVFEMTSGNRLAVEVNAGTGENGVTFSNNKTYGDGGGIMSIYAGTMTFNGDYNFINNHTENYGGAIAMYEAAGNITFNGKTTFTGNYATDAFGGAVDIWGGASTLTFNGPTTFTGNHVVSGLTGTNNPRGGAVNIGYTSPGSGASVVHFNNSVVFDGNYIVSTGAGGSAYGGALSAYGNGASYNYQYIFDGPALFQNNYAAKVGSGSGGGYGGAIYYDSSAALLQFHSGTRFLDNMASTYGGAIYLQSGRIVLDAHSGDIEFRGNRQGVQFDEERLPISGTGTPNAIMLGSGGTLELDAAAGHQIRFRDPIASRSSSKAHLIKVGEGEVIFYGDKGATSLYDSNIAIDTTVSGGYFTLADSVKYGTTDAGDFIVTAGANGTAGTLRGGDQAQLNAHAVTIEDKGTVTIDGGTFTLESPNIHFQGGSRLTGSGTLAANNRLTLDGTVAAAIDAGKTLQISPSVVGNGGLDVQSGTLTLGGDANAYTGTTRIATGATLASTLQANAFAQSSAMTVDGTFDMSNNLSQTANNLSGSGTINLGTQASTTLTAANSSASAFSGKMSGGGSLVKTGTGTLTLSGINTYTGGTTISAGQLTGTNAGAFGTGAIVNNGALNLDFAANSALVNTISGTGGLTKTGSGVTTLTSTGTQGSTTVTAGELRFGQTGVFNTGAHSTASGATTSLLGHSQLAVTDTFTQASGATLNVEFADNLPVITAKSATIDGSLNITGFTSPAPDTASELIGTQFNVLETTDGITGDFSSLNLGGASSALDFLIVSGAKSEDQLSYSIGLALTWFGGPTVGNGNFTLTGASERFNVDLVLSDQEASGTGWSGTTLNKNGAGNLVLSAANTYTGATVVNGGTLTMGIADAIATSESVTINTGSTLALGDFDQTVHALSGAGTIELGSSADTVLTTVNATDTTFRGTIHGAGSLTKTGDGTLTLSGASTFTGGITNSSGTLVGAGGGAFGTGTVTNNAAVRLDFASSGVLTNVFAGAGSLTKTGTGTAMLTSPGAQGAVSVEAGALVFNQTGVFQADSLTTATGAATLVTGDARLNVTNGFDMASGTTLGVVLGSNQPVVAAGSATIDGALYIVGFAPSGPNTASGLTGTRFTLLETTGGITGEFTSKNFGGAATGLDYLLLDARKSEDNLSYIAGLGLTWRSGAETGDGSFTLGNAGDLFNVDVVLADQAASATGWDGTTLTKNGAGTLMLSAANTYTGPTLVNEGTLSMGAADGFASSRAVTLAEGTTLALNDFSQTANDLSGAGKITLGSSADTVLTINNAADRTLSGTISGAGALLKTGGGTLILGDTNTYAGGTTISAGGVYASAASLGTGDVVNNGALTIDQPADATFAAAIHGTGHFTKTGAGALNLTGNGTLSGPTTVAAGMLSVNGSLANSAMTVQSGATLAGSGAVGGTSVLAGGTMAPGNSIGTLQVKGAYSQAAGATYQAEVDVDSNASDLVQVDGTATLEPGAVLNVNRAGAGALTRTTRYTVLSTTGGLTGTFSLTGDLLSGFYKLVGVYDAFNAYLETVRVRDFTDAAVTPNEIATAAGANSLPDDSPIKVALNSIDNDADVRLGLNQLSGEIHASLKTGLLNDSRQVRDTAVARIRQAGCSPDVGPGIEAGTPRPTPGTADTCTAGRWQPVGWVRVFGDWGTTDSDGNAAELKANTGGMLIGTDVNVFDTWRVGALAGYSHGTFKANDRSSSADTDSYHVGIYGGTQRDRLGLRLGSSFTWHEIDTDRSPTFPGFNEHHKSGYDGRTMQVFGDFGYQLTFSQGTLEPFLGVAYVNLHNESFDETGGVSALIGDSETTSTTFGTVGVRGARAVNLGSLQGTVRGTLGWQHAFGDVVPTSTLAFRGGTPFVIAAVPVARNAALIELGLDAKIKKNTTLSFSLAGQFGGGANSQTVQATLRTRF